MNPTISLKSELFVCFITESRESSPPKKDTPQKNQEV